MRGKDDGNFFKELIMLNWLRVSSHTPINGTQLAEPTWKRKKETTYLTPIWWYTGTHILLKLYHWVHIQIKLSMV
jgi:hypothetical protein